MSKFYIQSGEFKDVVKADNYVEALSFSIDREIDKSIKKNKFTKTAKNFFISRIGFMPKKRNFKSVSKFPFMFSPFEGGLRTYKEFSKMDWDFIPERNCDLFLDADCISEIMHKKWKSN